MVVLAMIRHGFDRIRLKPFDINWRSMNRTLPKEDEIEDAMEIGVFDAEKNPVYDAKQLIKEGIYALIGSEGEVLWSDKLKVSEHDKITIRDMVCRAGLWIDKNGNLEFCKSIFISSGSTTPDMLVLNDNGLYDVDIKCQGNSYRFMNIRSANCKFQIDRIDAIFINNDASNLEVKCGEYLFSFDISEVSLIEKMDINSLYLVKEEKDEIDKKRKILFLNIKKDIDKLSSLLNEMTGHWGFEDPIYRFYHESFKVYSIQESTKKICKALQELLPGETLNTSFMKIIELGTNKKFTLDVNQFWFMETLPLTTAFFHARFMLDMVVKYGKELKGQPEVLPSGWASVLYLYNLR